MRVRAGTVFIITSANVNRSGLTAVTDFKIQNSKAKLTSCPLFREYCRKK